MGRLSSPPARLKAAPFRLGLVTSTAVSSGVTPGGPPRPWRAWYNTTAWRKLRLEIFLRDLYTCQMCGRVEGDTSLLVCDHRRPHRGDKALFWDRGNLQTLCKSPCHDKHKQALEQTSRHQAGVWD